MNSKQRRWRAAPEGAARLSLTAAVLVGALALAAGPSGAQEPISDSNGREFTAFNTRVQPSSVGIFDGHSREFTVFNTRVHPSAVSIVDAHSRECTVFSNRVHPSPVDILDGCSREFTAFNTRVHPSAVAIADGHSRELTAFNTRVHPSSVEIADGHGREFTIYSNFLHPGPSPISINDAHSREFTLFNSFAHPSDVPVNDASSRESTVWNYWPPSIVREEADVPSEFTLRSPHPNPFTGETSVVFGLPREAAASLSVYDAAGRRILKIAPDAPFRAGWHTLKIGDRGWPQGVYFYRFQSEANVRSGKVVLRK